MRSAEAGTGNGAAQRVYDADQVDTYICSLLAAVAELETQLNRPPAALRATALPTIVSDAAGASLGQTLLMAQMDADAIITAAHGEAEAVLAVAAEEVAACLAAARVEADRLLTEARRAIETFLRNWDDQLCNQVSEARRRMFGGFGRHSGPRRMPADVGSIESAEQESSEAIQIGQQAGTRRPVRFSGRPHQRLGTAHLTVAPQWDGRPLMSRSAGRGA